ncbi:MAG: hypothetical protein JJT77_08465 [Crocinitomicaceae bacterium]|nr:hypothetical protein [Crocinitomicaceae bacterium]
MLLILFSCFLITTIKAQGWEFNLRLNFRPIQLQLYKNDFIENNNENQFLNYPFVKITPFYAYVEKNIYVMLSNGIVSEVVDIPNQKYSRKIHPRFFEGEIMLDVYRYSPKLLFGFGWASNQGSIYAGVLSNGTVEQDPNNDYYSIYFDGFSFKSNQLYVYVNRQLGKEDGWLRHHFIGGLGIDIASGLNRQAVEFLVPSVQQNHEGYKLISNPLILNSWPSLIAKYELEFRTKSGKNILGLNVTYNQGLLNVYEHSVTASMSNGSFLTSRSTSRGSGFRIGISKKFQFNGNY